MPDPPTNHERQSNAGKDSRLDAFLRQASAIIASEKGMTSVCRIKLQTLATSMKLPPALLEKALEQLQAPGNDPSQLTRYESAYVEFLKREFEQLAGGVLSPKSEQAALRIAGEKYQIFRTRAEQLLDHVCEDRDVSRISHLEASGFARQAIHAIIKDKRFLDDESKSQIRQIGEEWGLDELAVDKLAFERVELNRRESAPNKTRLAALSMILGGLMSLVILFLVGEGRWWNVTGSVQGPEIEQAKPETRSNDPGDRASELTSLTDDFVKRFPQSEFGKWARELSSSSSDDSKFEPLRTSSAIESLFRLGSEDQVRQAEPILKSLLLRPAEGIRDRDTFRNEAIETMVKLVDPFQLPIDEAQRQAPRAFRRQLQASIASRDFIANLGEAIDSDDKLHQMVQRSLERSDFDATFLNSKVAFEERLWQQLAALALSEPAWVSNQLVAVSDVSQTLEPSRLKAFQANVLIAILQTNPQLADQTSQFCTQAIASAKDKQLEWWANFISKETNLVSRVTLAEALSEVLPDSSLGGDPVDAVIQFHRSVVGRKYQLVVARAAKLDRLAEDCLDSRTDEYSSQQLPNRIAQLIQLVNAEIELGNLLNNERFYNEASFRQFDTILFSDEVVLKDCVTLASEGKAEQLRPTASDQRAKASVMEHLSSKAATHESSVQALQQLTRVAGRFSDLSRKESVILARFLASDFNLKHQLKIQQLLGTFSHWNRLGLAFADEIEPLQSPVDRDRALTFSRLLIRKPFELESENWRAELHQKMLQAIFARLSSEIYLDPFHPASDWNRLEIFARTANKLRSSLIGNSELTQPGNHWNEQQLSNSVFAEEFASNDMERLSQSNLEWVSSKITKSTGTIGDLKARLTRSREAGNVGEKYYYSEQLLLQFFHRRRTRLMEQKLPPETRDE